MKRACNFFVYTKKGRKITALIVAILLVGFVFIYEITRPPESFLASTLFTIEKGQTLTDVSSALYEKGLINSKFWFNNIAIGLYGDDTLKAGDYFFSKPIGVFAVVQKMTEGDYGLTPIKITIPEGINIYETAEILAEKLPKFNPKIFLDNVTEGFLFPDTYYFLANAEALQAVYLMNDNFERKLESIEPQMIAFGKPLDDVLVLASILEEEARTTETRRIISGVLWKRLSIGMPLQVDVTFQYINGKNTYELSAEDLNTDSPYNTYKYKGLPPTPISSPSLDAILAAVTPIKTNYLYFLSDKVGNMYYAEDFESHQRNRELYLNRE